MPAKKKAKQVGVSAGTRVSVHPEGELDVRPATPPRKTKAPLETVDVVGVQLHDVRLTATDLVERAMHDRVPALAPETYNLILTLKDKIHELTA